MVSDTSLLFSPSDEQEVGRNYCFLCGTKLPVERATDEHVFPKWVQNRFNLWDQNITLLNGTTIPYRQLTIPCCSQCNSVHLSQIEQKVQQAFDVGPKAVSSLDEITLFIWLAKIFYGLLYREHLLKWGRSSESDEPIVPAEALEEFRLHHMFLQAARIPFAFATGVPASIYVFETLQPSNEQMGFDFWDSWAGLLLSIRVGRVGVIACLQDGGAHRRSFDYSEFGGVGLHPIQFAEVTAKIFYEASRLNRVPKFLIAEREGVVQVAQAPIGGLGGGYLFDDGSPSEFAIRLAHCTRFPLEQLHRQPDRIVSWLRDSDGNLRTMNADDLP